jgi:hypothetical protein
MDVTISLLGADGHTELKIEDRQIRLKWNKAGMMERRMLRDLLTKARERGFEPYEVDGSGKAVKITKNLPGVFRGSKGELVLKSTPENIKKIAGELVDIEIADGHIVLEAQKDHTWKALKKGEFKPDEKEPKTLQSVKAVAGG